MEFYTLKDLADSWTVTRPTAREHTRDADFPPCLDLRHRRSAADPGRA